MFVYIALLRGINVSGQKKIKMVDLRSKLEKLPFYDVKTYIQSGNLVFKSKEADPIKLQILITEEIAKSFGFEVPVVVKSHLEFKQIVQANPYTNIDDITAKKIYFTILQQAAVPEALPNLDPKNYPNELFQITQNCVYLNCKNGAGKAKLNNNIIESKLEVLATTRNHRTMLKLLEMAEM